MFWKNNLNNDGNDKETYKTAFFFLQNRKHSQIFNPATTRDILLLRKLQISNSYIYKKQTNKKKD